MIWRLLLVQYDLVDYPLYNIYLGATHTTIPSTRGVQIPIDLVSSATDSFWRRVVLFKHVRIPTSDPKSEFLYQSSSTVRSLQTSPWITSYAWDISHTLVTTYHPYCHNPSALTEYLKQKLRLQWAKRLGHSLPAQVEQSVQLERNTLYTTAGSRKWGRGGIPRCKLVSSWPQRGHSLNFPVVGGPWGRCVLCCTLCWCGCSSLACGWCGTQGSGLCPQRGPRNTTGLRVLGGWCGWGVVWCCVSWVSWRRAWSGSRCSEDVWCSIPNPGHSS